MWHYLSKRLPSSIFHKNHEANIIHSSARYLTKEQKDKQFVEGPTPYQREKKVCILCKNKIKLDYKNPRLLSQFVSPLNGHVYEKRITGLCENQQKILVREVKRSIEAMLMPRFYRNPKYNKDPCICQN